MMNHQENISKDYFQKFVTKNQEVIFMFVIL